ncbi:hypothetical protein I5H06_gp01 [Mycobacterium phage SirPhilip]|uniref:Gene 1 ring forming protein domain-containing protein n=1 Tax=Mycobacterium phage SirPhilip TaxID=2015824 RepID=A0A222ZKC8_9CAUD|nr:hypothetical protein I5H06_gp01 [Mycobacterium phage SirPhilip]ASR85204.1 hypothetical protein SEA_SIRPHILIP_1 [Mycobacterium phage SirPhilip]
MDPSAVWTFEPAAVTLTPEAQAAIAEREARLSVAELAVRRAAETGNGFTETAEAIWRFVDGAS